MDRHNIPSDEEVITGIHPVAEALASGERIERVMIGEGRQNDQALKGIIAGARAASVPISFVAESSFRAFREERHQHVAAVIKRFVYTPWHDVRAAVKSGADALVVVLDHVEDPHNLGAVLRNAEGAGATAAVIPDRRSAAVTPAARRAAAGASSHLRIASVPNLARAIEDLKADGCWVYGLSTGPGAVSYADVDFAKKCVFIVGSEGKGLSRLIAQRCDRLVRIPLAGKVASLNASSAAAIALFEALRQRAHAEIVTPKNKRQTGDNP